MSMPGVVDQIWREQSQWSALADRMKRGIENARAMALVLIIVVAVLGTGSAALSGADALSGRILAAGAALGAALVPILRPRFGSAAIRDWTRARSVSEALKSDVYRWLAQPQVTELSDLQARLDTLHDDTTDLRERLDGVEAQPRPLPAVNDPSTYVTVRVLGQIESFYRPRARQLKKRLDRFDRAALGLAFIGALLGAAAAVFGTGIAAWIAVVTTIGTALSAHVAATRYRFQRLEYLRTAGRLSQLGDHVDLSSTEAATALIHAAEEAITAENQAWMAKLVKDDAETTT